MKSSPEDFVAYVAHELRSPIAVIRGFAELLQEHPEMSDMISEKILRNALRLEKLVQNLLSLADESSPLNQTIELIKLCVDCKEKVLSKYPNAQISVHGAEGLHIQGDAELLEIALCNLLENGCKYSKGPARIDVHIVRNAKGVQIDLKDYGIGMEKMHLPHIFDRFYSADKPLSRKLGGVGLGLSLVKNIIQKHGGSISVTSEVGHGSLFTIFLRC